MGLTRITSDGITDATIATADLADQSVTLAKLPHGTSSNDGKFLRANNGADPTFETVSSVGGSTGVDFNDNVKARFGTGNDLEIFHDSNDSIINDGGTGDLKFQVGGSTKFQSYFVSGETGGLKLDGTVLKFEGISQSSDQPNVNTGNPSMIWVFDEELNIAGYGKISFIEQGFKRWTIDNGALHPHGTTYNNLGNSSNRVGNAYIQTSVDLIDNAKLLLGSSDDLQIYHDGSHNIINGATGQNLEIQTNAFRVRNQADSESMIVADADGGVELYHNNSKKFETSSTGGIFRGTTWTAVDNCKIAFGTGDDLKIFHDGSNSFIEDSGTGSLMIESNSVIRLRDNTGNVDFAKFINGGGVELYHNNIKRLDTTSGGINVVGNVKADGIRLDDNDEIRVGTGDDLKIYHDGSNSYIRDEGTGNLNIDSTAGAVKLRTNSTENSIICNENGSVELYHDNSKKLETISGGITVTGGINTTAASTFNQSNFNSGAGAVTINGGSDIRFTSGNWTGNSGSTPKIQAHSNYLYIVGGSNGIIFREDGTDRWFVEGSGHFRPASNNTYDIGNTSQRVRNIYTNDLHLSNEGSSNDVDGTWGSYTIQEGAEDLFLVNRRNGKKYKFNLTEVS